MSAGLQNEMRMAKAADTSTSNATNEARAFCDACQPSVPSSALWLGSTGALAVLLLIVLLLAIRRTAAHASITRRQEAEQRCKETRTEQVFDNLLQNTQGLMYAGQALIGRLAPTDPQRRSMEEALDRTELLMGEARDRLRDLWTVCPSGMAETLGRDGRELGQSHATNFSVATQGRVRPLKPGVGDLAYRIAREALTNAFKHAGASRIDLKVAFDATGMTLNVRDDGAGIADHWLQGERSAGWGIRGMHARTRCARGRLEFRTHPGRGTEVELYLPADVAFEVHRGSVGWLGWWLPARTWALKRRNVQNTPDKDGD